MSTDSDQFDLHARLEYCGPRKPVYGAKARPYYCTYCFAVLQLCPHEFRVCQSRTCIEQAIDDRKERIWEVELSIPQTHRKLNEEKRALESTIQELEGTSPDSLVMAQYKSLLATLNANLNFYAKNVRVNEILALEEQIKELVKRLPRPTFSDSFRCELWNRDGRICYICHRPIKHWRGANMHIDHVIPRSKGGSDDAQNLRIAHPSCNLQKGDRDLGDRRMRAVLRELRKSDEEKAKERLF